MKKINLTMVIADDEPLSLKSEELFIRNEFPGIDIIGLAENGIELKRMLEELKPDIAIVDICMPGLSGIEVIELLQHKDCATHFIINTAYSNFEYIKKALDLKTDGYLLKPGKREENIEVINRLCRTVENEKEENAKQSHLKSALNVLNPVLGNEILMSIFSETCDEENFETYCSINCIEFSFGCIVTFLPKTKEDISRKVLNNELNTALQGICNFLTTITEHSIVVMLFVPVELEKEKQKNWCEEIARLVAKRLGQQAGIEYIYGVGNVYDSFSAMRDSYKSSIKEFQADGQTESVFFKENADKIESYIAKAKTYVNTYFVDDISLIDCAKSVGISSYYLSHIFKNKTGKTFVEYLSIVRMIEAKRLLANPNLTIRDIAERCGYYNITYFCKVFKRCTGKTIGEFRRQEMNDK
jgi:Response regulator containing CheY-like receiver domain and AraC-type DNA-binding domain